MSTYLRIAERVLQASRRPMSARAILKQAYLAGLVPEQLFGATQHKTLQARLSEDILQRREHSPFFRTRPGIFFLRKFLTDPTLPPEFRQEMTARRRTRELLRGPALAVDCIAMTASQTKQGCWDAYATLEEISRQGSYSYVDPKKPAQEHLLLWAVSAVIKNRKVLCYRLGRYRDDRDNFVHKRSIGFSTLVLQQDRSLFDNLGFGIEDAALAAVATDLNVPLGDANSDTEPFRHTIKFLTLFRETRFPELLAFVQVDAPRWFEPSTTRLSLNDMNWLDLDIPPNNLDDFDPWSKTLLKCYFDRGGLNG